MSGLQECSRKSKMISDSQKQSFAKFLSNPTLTDKLQIPAIIVLKCKSYGCRTTWFDDVKKFGKKVNDTSFCPRK